MLDVMRRANRQKWFLGAVVMFVVFAFVASVFAIWGGAASISDPTGMGWVAQVNDVEIPAIELEREKQQVEAAIRGSESGQGFQEPFPGYFYRLAADRLISRSLAYQHAQSLGLSATDREVSRAIRNAPVFQRNGKFIGTEQYIQELVSRGFDVAEYERMMGREIVVGKLQDLMASMVEVTPAEVEQAFVDEGMTAEVDYVVISSADFDDEAFVPGRAELETHYEAHREEYRTPERRSVTYTLIEREPILDSVEVSEAEIQAEYDANQSRFTQPEQRRASHILFEVLPEATAEEEQAVRARAEAVLEQVRGGGDFEQLARENSSDELTADAGGDIGWFGRQDMVPEFSEAAFSLSEGEVSDLVRSQYGFHIIRSTGSRPAGLQPLEEIRDQLERSLSFRRVQELMQQKAQQLRAKLDQQVSSFEVTAAELGYPVSQSDFFARDEAIGDLGPQPRAADEAFNLKPGEHSPAIPIGRGMLFLRLDEVKPSAPAPFDEVKDQVTQDLNEQRSMDLARRAAGRLVSAGFDGFKKTADEMSLSISSTGEFTRVSAPPVFTDEVNDAVFTSEANRIVGPVDVANGAIVLKLFKRGPESEEDAQRIKDDLADALLERERREAFSALLQSLIRSASITQNEQLFQEIARRSAPPQ